MRNTLSIFFGSALIVMLNLAGSCAVIALTTGMWLLPHENGIEGQSAKSLQKGDRLRFRDVAPSRLPDAGHDLEHDAPASTPRALALEFPDVRIILLTKLSEG